MLDSKQKLVRIDDFNYNDISKKSEREIANMAITRKYSNGQDVQLVIPVDNNGNVIEFDSVGCETADDVLRKYPKLFNKAGFLPFHVTKHPDADYYNIVLDLLNEKGENIKLTTKNCGSAGDFSSKYQHLTDNNSFKEIMPIVGDYVKNNEEKLFENNNLYNQSSDSNLEEKVVAPVNSNSESASNSTNVVIPNERISALEESKKRVERNIEYCESYALGRFNINNEITPSFDERRQQIRNRIPELENNIAKYQSMDMATDFITADEKLNDMVKSHGEYLSNDSVEAIKFYEMAKENPNKVNVMAALQKASLSMMGDVKHALLTSISFFYKSHSELAEDNDIINYINKLNFKTDKQILDDSKIELEKLKKDITSIGIAENIAKHQVQNSLNGAKKELSEIEAELNNIRNSIGHQETELVTTEKDNATDPANKTEEVDLNEKLLLLENRKNSLIDTIAHLEKVCLGELDMNGVITPGFESRKQELKEQITKLESEVAKYQSMNIVTDLATAEQQLKKCFDLSLSNNTRDIVQYCVNVVAAIPDKNNLLKALEYIQKLPKDNPYDNEAINAMLTLIVYLNENHLNKDDTKEDAKEISDNINNVFNFKTDKQKMDSCVNELNKLNEQFNEIEQNEKEIISKVEGKLNLHKQELVRVENEINSIKEKINGNVQQSSGNKLIEDQQNKVNSNENGVTKEIGRIFTDEERFTEKDKMLSLPNEKYEGKLGNDNKIILDGIDITPKDDKFNVPRPIRAIKKAGKSLIEKINSIDFKKKIKAAVDWFKKHLGATFIMGVVALGVVAASSFGKSNDSPVVSDTHVEHSYEQDDKDNSYNVPPANLINQDAVDATIKDLNMQSTRPGFEDIDLNINSNNNGGSQNNSFNTVVSDLSSSIVDGSTAVYTQENHAFDEINAVPTSKLYTPSWENAEANAFFTNDNGSISQISQEQAETKYNNGEEVVVRMENDGVNIGFVNIENGNQNNTGMSR